MIVLVTVGRRPAPPDDPLALPARRLRVPRRTTSVAAALVADGVDPERAELLARLAGGRLDRARALDGRPRAGARGVRRRRPAPLDGTGGAVAVAGGARPGRAAGARSRISRRRRPRRPSELDARSSRRRGIPNARSGRSCDGSRSGTSASTGTRAPTRCIEGITALETVYRDALAGPGAEPLNLDRAVLALRRPGARRARSTRAATHARRSPSTTRTRRCCSSGSSCTSRLPACESRCPPSGPDRARYTRRRAGVAQTAEQLTRNEQAKGSSPFSGSTQSPQGL